MLPGCVPWPEDLARSYREKGYWRDFSLPHYFANLVAVTPKRLAIIDGERRLTLEDIWIRSLRLAANLHGVGLRSRQIVVFQLPNSAEFLITFLALTRLGVIPVLALPSHRQTEISHYVRASGASALFIPDRIRDFDFKGMARMVRETSPALRDVFVLGATTTDEMPLSDLINSDPPATSVAAIATDMPDPSDIALMLLSGGTTALPKLIPRTHNDYVYNFEQSARVSGFGPETIQLIVLPMAHNYNLGSPGMLGAIASGGRVVIAPKADTSTVFALVAKERVTTIPAAVPLFVNWLNDPTAGQVRLQLAEDCPEWRCTAVAGTQRPCAQDVSLPIPGSIWDRGGITQFHALDDDDEKVLMSSGAPMCPDDEIKVIDEEGSEVPDGEKGELITRGPYTIRGYYNAPDSTPEPSHRTVSTAWATS